MIEKPGYASQASAQTLGNALSPMQGIPSFANLYQHCRALASQFNRKSREICRLL
jgi:hypothetical protein